MQPMPPVTAKCSVSAKALFYSLDRVLKPGSSSNRSTQPIHDARAVHTRDRRIQHDFALKMLVT